jgi:hypothetical protein
MTLPPLNHFGDVNEMVVEQAAQDIIGAIHRTYLTGVDLECCME